jgi:4-hydroxy-tetrahydrodipicolinate synthase
MPELSMTMLDALRRDDPELAMRVHAAASPFEQLRARHGNGNNVPVVKEALALLGIAGNMVRPPLARLSRQDAEELRSMLDRWESGIFG